MEKLQRNVPAMPDYMKQPEWARASLQTGKKIYLILFEPDKEIVTYTSSSKNVLKA